MIENKFQKSLEGLISDRLKPKSYKLVLGVSGGPDSVCLLDLVSKVADFYELKLVVASLDHGIRGAASAKDSKFVAQISKKYGIKFITKKVDTKKFAKQNKLNLEEAARKLRYDFFYQILKKEKADFVVTAHTFDDQVETVLMRFLRGSGIGGLAGILPKRDKVIRPLLGVSRQEIIGYCKKNRIQYRLDNTNLNQKILRNKIRYELIPYLLKYNPNLKRTITKTAALFACYRDDLLTSADLKYKKCIIERSAKKVTLDLREWQNLTLLYKTEVLRLAIRELLGEVMGFDQVHFEEMIGLLERSEPKKYKNLPRGLRLTKERGKFIIDYQPK